MNKIPVEDPKFILILIPKVGSTTIKEFDDPEKGFEELTRWLDEKDKGTFDGDVVPVLGVLVDYTTPLRSYGFKVPGVPGLLEGMDKQGVKLVGPKPEQRPEEPG